MYDPKTIAFLSPGPLGDSGENENLYIYCRNDLINRVDPSGKDDVDITQEVDVWYWSQSYRLIGKDATAVFKVGTKSGEFVNIEFGTAKGQITAEDL